MSPCLKDVLPLFMNVEFGDQIHDSSMLWMTWGCVQEKHAGMAHHPANSMQAHTFAIQLHSPKPFPPKPLLTSRPPIGLQRARRVSDLGPNHFRASSGKLLQFIHHLHLAPSGLQKGAHNQHHGGQTISGFLKRALAQTCLRALYQASFFRSFFGHSKGLVQGEGGAPGTVHLHDLRVTSHVLHRDVPLGWYQVRFF